MKITRKHIFIISGIIGLIVLVIIIIKVANTTPKTCDTSSGKKLYCNGENTVCIDCGQGKTYDCDKGMCVVTCDTSTGNTSYCEDTVCAKCGEGQTYDCVGNKKCFCDTSTGNTSYCEDTVCAKCGEGKTYNCDEKKGVVGCICDTGYTQCDTICCPDETQVCVGSICCDKEKKCNYNDGIYTTCCKPGESCIGNTCVSNCTGDVPFCGTGTICCDPVKETCFGNTCVTNCPNSAPFCGTGCCAADESCTTGGVCCKNGEPLYCNNTVCAKCGVGQTYDCDVTKKCKCDDGHPVLCGADLCCAIGQTCTIDPTKPNPNSCCPFGQECGTKNADGSFPSCCLSGYMCDGNGSCVQRCGTGDGQYLNCVYGTNLCVKAENLSDSEKTQLLKDAKTNTNIVDKTVVCDGNDCSFCVVSNQSKFDPQDRQYPEKVGQLSPGSYIIKNTGDNNPGYCTNATVTYSTDCNTIGLETSCNLPDCKWVSFIPPTTTKTVDDVNSFYSTLNNQFALDENNINRAEKHDVTYDYLGVWKNANENAPSSNINIKTGVNTGISDCYTIYNGIDDVEKIIFRDTDPANSTTSEKICLALSKFTSVEKKNCTDDISTTKVNACNDNGNITFDTSCKSSCADTNYTLYNWYNQGTAIWGCFAPEFNYNNIKPCDTITNFCPDYMCTETQITSAPDGRQSSKPLECKLTTKTMVPVGTFYAYNACKGTINTAPAHIYCIPVVIINKTSSKILCQFSSSNSGVNDIYIEPIIGATLPWWTIAVKGASYNGTATPYADFQMSFDDGITFSGFQIHWVASRYACVLTNFSVNSDGITGSIFTDKYTTASVSETTIGVSVNGVTVVYYPTRFQNLPDFNTSGSIDLLSTGTVDTMWRINSPKK
jgi:hypothetical protein